MSKHSKTATTINALFMAMALFSPFSIAAETVNKPDAAFSLPAGNYQAGKEAFIDLQCTACHSINGVDLPAADEMFDTSVLLSKPTLSKTESALVTAIINPSHSLVEGLPIESIYSDGNSKMPIFNDLMTVTQLIDIVTFLRANNK